MLLILAFIFCFFQNRESTGASTDFISYVQARKRIESATKTSSQRKGFERSTRMSRIEKVISEKFPEERDIEFNNSISCLAEFYRSKGLIDFCGQMRSALRGDNTSLAEIFTTYMAEPESYGIFINILIENLGDDFFFKEVQKQPESTQYLILGLVWQKLKRSKLDYQSGGSIPVADSGQYYPKCGELFLRRIEEELKSAI
jgi:hypothetical protein